MTRQSFADIDCAVAQAVEQVGDKWTLVILRNAFQGMTRFDEFAEHLGVASNVLTTRLDALVQADILYRRKVDHDRRAVEYKLTPKGFDLFPLIVFLNQWGERWMGKRRGPRLEIFERTSGQPVRPVQVLAHHGQVLTARDTFSREGAGGGKVLQRSREIVSRRRAVRP